MMTWSSLKRIAEIRLVKSMYIWLFIVPIAANTLAGVKENVSFSLGGQVHQLALGLPFSWSVFFFSALLFSVASGMYFYHCPKIIKENGSYGDFKDNARSIFHLATYASEIDETSDSIRDKLEGNDEGVSFMLPISEPCQEDSGVQKTFDALSASADEFKPKARAIAAGCYVLGGLAIAWVMVQNILTVTSHAF